MSDNTEIKLTDTFKANDMIADNDLVLRFKIREVLDRAKGVSNARKAAILDDERMKLLEIDLDSMAAAQRLEHD